MSYELDLKLQNLLANNIKPPMGYITEIDWNKTENNPKSCAHAERKILGKGLSRKQRKKTLSKINFFKSVMKISSTPTDKNLEELLSLVDEYFNAFKEKKITGKEFYSYFEVLNNIEMRIRRGEDFGSILKSIGMDAIEEIESDEYFYGLMLRANIITLKEYDDLCLKIEHRKNQLYFSEE